MAFALWSGMRWDHTKGLLVAAAAIIAFCFLVDFAGGAFPGCEHHPTWARSVSLVVFLGLMGVFSDIVNALPNRQAQRVNRFMNFVIAVAIISVIVLVVDAIIDTNLRVKP